ncbi:hypothetical protein FQN54_004739 [Arachnomyces sp. PD_36]|nr:hypothetical protein FQN54_004739 [Arachnomyces sp. PD_36]
MPTFANIKVSLVSQFELVTLPEHILPNSPEDKFRRYSGPAAQGPLPTPTSPFIAEPSSSPVITLYVSNTAGSRFWVDYAISGPQNINSLYYFQLSVNDKHVLSWGCGEKEGFGGKEMFKIFESFGGQQGQGLLGYGESAMELMMMQHQDLMRDVYGMKTVDIKVCRASNRYRVGGDEKGNRMFAVGTGCETAGLMGSSANLFEGAFAMKGNTQSMYKYALIDPVDKPYVTFRYVYNSWNQLEVLGVTELPDDQHIDAALARVPTTTPFNQVSPFENLTDYDPFQPVPTTAHSTCSIFVPPTYEYFHLPPLDRAHVSQNQSQNQHAQQHQQPFYPGSPIPQTARSTCSIFLPPPPTPPRSPSPVLATPTRPSVIVTPPSGQQSYILPVPLSAKKSKKGKQHSKNGTSTSTTTSSSGSGSPPSTCASERIYNSSLPLRTSTPTSSSSPSSTASSSGHTTTTIIHKHDPTAPPPLRPAKRPTNTHTHTHLPYSHTRPSSDLSCLIAYQELRIKRATAKGLEWLKANFPEDRKIPEPLPILTREEVGGRLVEILSRRGAAGKTETGTGAGTAAEARSLNGFVGIGTGKGAQGGQHMMSVITRKERGRSFGDGGGR